MRAQVQVAPHQIALVVAQVVWASALIYVPPFLVRIARADAWLSVLLGALAGGIVLGICCLLQAGGARGDLYDWAEQALGSVAGRLVGGVYAAFFLITAARDLRYVGDFFVTIPLHETPIIVVLIGLALLCAWLVRLGPEALCRVNASIFVVAFVVLLSVPVTLAPEMRAKYLLPVMERGPGPVWQAAYSIGGWFAEVVMAALFLPLGRTLRQSAAAAFAGLGIGTLSLLVLIFTPLTVFGPELMGYLVKPSDTLVTIISLGAAAERIDMILIAVWQPAVTLRIALSLYAATIGTARVLHLRDHRPLSLALGAAAVTLSVWCWGSQAESVHFGMDFFPAVSLVLGIAVPLLMLGVMAGKRLRRSAPHA